jgi:hypothetical protein
MPRYYFDTRLGELLVRDEAGIDLPDDVAAFETGVHDLRELLATRTGSKVAHRGCSIEVLNDRRHFAFRVSCTEARNLLSVA